MNWIYFIVGFISFPVVVLLFILWANKRTQVDPFLINDANQFQDLVGRLFRKGKNGDILYVLDRGSEFIVRIIKMERKTKEDTLRVEIRASDKNADGFLTAKKLLNKEGIEFDEKLTPKLKKPSRLYLKNDEGGVFTVSSMSQAVIKVMRAINKENEFDVLASEQDPHFWNKIKTEPEVRAYRFAQPHP